MSDKNQESRPPEKNFRLGNVSATVWCNSTSDSENKKSFRTVQVEQRFQDSNSGEWKSSNRFSIDQLLRLRVCIDKAIDHISSKEME